MASTHWVKTIAALGALGMLIPLAAAGQAKGGPTTPPTTGTGSTSTGSTGSTTSRPTTTSSTTSPTNAPSSMGTPQPIFLSGRVVIDDGAELPGPVVIETVCSRSAHAEGYTDSRGYFSIQLGASNGVIQDASEYNSRGFGGENGMTTTGNASGGLGSSQAMERRLMGCDLQAKLGGYRSQAVSLAGRRAMDNPDLGTILLHRNGPAEEGQTVSAVSLLAPKDARKAYDKGLDAIKKQKFSEAQTSFEKAVEAYPKYAAAWFELGKLQVGQGKADDARGYFGKALECDAKFVQPYLQLAILDLQASRWRSLVDTTDKLVKLDPFDYPQAFFFNSVGNYNLQNFADAEKSALAAERLDTRHAVPEASHLLGLILAMKKDYAGAAERLKTYLKYAPETTDTSKAKARLAEIEKITAAEAAAKDR